MLTSTSKRMIAILERYDVDYYHVRGVNRLRSDTKEICVAYKVIGQSNSGDGITLEIMSDSAIVVKITTTIHNEVRYGEK